MTRSHNLCIRSHYETIGVKEDATQEEIRKTYRSAIIAFHPDKLVGSLGDEFIELQRAWRVLCDPGLRALYDHELRTLRQEALAAEDVRLGDMVVVEDEEEEEDEDEDGDSFELSYQCRCGDFFSIMSCELDEMGFRVQRIGGDVSLHSPSSSSLPASIVLPCGSCSLKLRLVID